MRDNRPRQMCAAFRPGFEVELQIPFERGGPELFGFTFVLDCLFACSPTTRNEGAGRPGGKIRIFASIPEGVEDNIEVGGDRDSNQSRLRSAIRSDGAEHS